MENTAWACDSMDFVIKSRQSKQLFMFLYEHFNGFCAGVRCRALRFRHSLRVRLVQFRLRGAFITSVFFVHTLAASAVCSGRCIPFTSTSCSVGVCKSLLRISATAFALAIFANMQTSFNSVMPPVNSIFNLSFHLLTEPTRDAPVRTRF